MKPTAIKKLLKFDIAELKKAEELLCEEKPPPIDIEGDDEGEKLTHIFGAIFIKEKLASDKNADERTALREFMGKVRNSIN